MITVFAPLTPVSNWLHSLFSQIHMCSNYTRHALSRILQDNFNVMLYSQYNRMLRCSPEMVDSTNQKRLAAYARAYRDVFRARMSRQWMVKLYKRSIFFSSRRHNLPSKVMPGTLAKWRALVIHAKVARCRHC